MAAGTAAIAAKGAVAAEAAIAVGGQPVT
jgi:hypothetical protein